LGIVSVVVVVLFIYLL